MGFKKEYLQIGVHKRKKRRAEGEPRIAGRLVPDPETWDRAYLAWEMRHEGKKLGEIHRATKLFSNKSSYSSFFDNLIYTGDVAFGGRIYENFVPAMIPREWYEKEQIARAERSEKYNGRETKPEYEPRRMGNDYLLSGLVFCGHIEGEEHPMHIGTIPAEEGKRGEYIYFQCSLGNNSRGERCQEKRTSLKGLDQAVIDNLLEHIVTIENLQPLADEIAAKLSERSKDAHTRIAAVQSKLDEVRRSMNNLLDAIEKMGYAPHIQDRYDERKREESELLAEMVSLEALTVKPRQIKFVTNDMLKQWVEHTRETLENGDRGLARRAIQQFVAKIVIKDGTGMMYYTFPLEGELYMPSVQKVDLKRLELLTSTVRL
ncbi:MAG: zinc ribbon domain-containing protein [Anaerolineae bacterium]|nr:zinc ribbon domain-containing protein [Anaerolineae bacterium]